MLNILKIICAVYYFKDEFHPIFAYRKYKNLDMDKRISTLIFIYVIYLLIVLAMLFSTNGQKVLTMMIFGGGGLTLLFMFFFLWLGNGKEK